MPYLVLAENPVEDQPEVPADPAVKETIWKGEPLDLGSDWSKGLQINSVPRLPEDARIHVVYEAPAGYDYYQFKFCYIDQNWGWNAMTSPVDVNEYGCVMLDPQKTEYVLALNDEDIAAINAGKGMVIQGYGAVITKVSFCALVFQCSGRKNKRFSVSLHFHQRTKRYFYEQEFNISSAVRSDIRIDILRQTGSRNPSDTSGTGDA